MRAILFSAVLLLTVFRFVQTASSLSLELKLVWFIVCGFFLKFSLDILTSLLCKDNILLRLYLKLRRWIN